MVETECFAVEGDAAELVIHEPPFLHPLHKTHKLKHKHKLCQVINCEFAHEVAIKEEQVLMISVKIIDIYQKQYRPYGVS